MRSSAIMKSNITKSLKNPRTKVEDPFLKKLAFVTNKYLAQEALGKCPRTTDNLSKYTAVRQ